VEAHCSRAVWVYQQISQPANSKPVITATTMQALALVLLGRASEAEPAAKICLEAAKQLPGPAAERASFVASCYNCLGEVLREMGSLAEAEAAAREGLAMREKVRWHGRARARVCVCVCVCVCVRARSCACARSVLVAAGRLTVVLQQACM
jgi:hypothetical protein